MIEELEHLLAQTSTSAIIGSLKNELDRLKSVDEEKAKPFIDGSSKHLESMKHVLLHLMICEKEIRNLISQNYNLHRENMELSRNVEQLEIMNNNLMNGI
jgi:hypothetical protein